MSQAESAAALPAPSHPDLAALLSLRDIEDEARRRMPPAAYEYVASGAGDELTLRWNAGRYQELRLRPNVLRDVSQLDTTLTLFGQKLTLPVLLAPTANQKMTHPEGELATARGADQAGLAMVLSSGANTDIHDVARVTNQALFFQLYVQNDRGLTEDIVRHAEAAGSRALFITVDNPVEAVRNRETRAGTQLPAGVGHPNYLGRPRARRFIANLEEVRPQKLDWELIEWLCSISRTPVVLKGIMTPEDAELAVKIGAGGIVVSNHGGRALDTVPATIDALPAVAERVAGRIPVLVDGGIRRGTDVLKALASGATATMIGRPYVYGLGVGGAAGVTHVCKTLRLEFRAAMALAGRRSLAEIDRTVLW
jgi:4-hydroxymandelate oxidase